MTTNVSRRCETYRQTFERLAGSQCEWCDRCSRSICSEPLRNITVRLNDERIRTRADVTEEKLAVGTCRKLLTRWLLRQDDGASRPRRQFRSECGQGQTRVRYRFTGRPDDQPFETRFRGRLLLRSRCGRK